MNEFELERDRERIKRYDGRLWTNQPNWRRFVRRLLGRTDD